MQQHFQEAVEPAAGNRLIYGKFRGEDMLDKSGSSFGRLENGAQASALRASLNYVSDTEPGIRRLRSGKGFSYRGPDGRALDRDALVRIKALAIPPAWTDVWISPDADGHIQATGRDQRGRK